MSVKQEGIKHLAVLAKEPDNVAPDQVYGEIYVKGMNLLTFLANVFNIDTALTEVSHKNLDK
jgi:hypothetical protein